LRTDPKISVGGLSNRVWRPGKNSILYPPCGVPILRELHTRIECADWMYGEEKKGEAAEKQSRGV
jgi:hypothetical protein